MEQVAPQLDEFVQVAPDAIEDDPVLLAGIRARAATGSDPNQDATSAAEERILAFQDENCPS